MMQASKRLAGVVRGPVINNGFNNVCRLAKPPPSQRFSRPFYRCLQLDHLPMPDSTPRSTPETANKPRTALIGTISAVVIGVLAGYSIARTYGHGGDNVNVLPILSHDRLPEVRYASLRDMEKVSLHGTGLWVRNRQLTQFKRLSMRSAMS